jgi:uncharacterized protein YkwD
MDAARFFLVPLLAAFLAATAAPPAVFAQVTPAGKSRAEQKKPDLDAAGQQVVERTNEFRRGHGLTELSASPELAQAASYFAGFMARTDRYGHEADGSTPSQRAQQHGYDYCIVGENIAYQFHSAGFETSDLAAALVKGWKESPRHREAMLDADVTETAVAIARSDRSGRFYAVQMFGRPRDEAVNFQITNRVSSAVRYELDGRAFTLAPRSTRTHEQCRAAELSIERPENGPVTAQPGGGERYAVVRDDNGRLALRSE